MKTLFSILIFCLFLFSCGKERSITIKAINAATGQAYAGLEYRVASSRTGINGEKYRTEASGVLDAHGMAVVNIKQKDSRTYSVRVVEPANTCYNKEITQYFDSPYDVNGTFTFEFAECAYLMQNVNNINCQGGGDYMILYTKNQVNSLGVTGWEFFGCNGYIGDHYSSVPIGKYYFQWEVTRNSITNTYYDTIYLSPGEYRTYDINY